MLIDLLVLLLIVILILNIQFENILNYKKNIKFSEKTTQILEQKIIVEELINNCDYLAKYDEDTKICYKNQIEDKVKNIDKLSKNLCEIKLNKKKIYENIINKKIKNKYKRGVVYNNEFAVIEVGFCE